MKSVVLIGGSANMGQVFKKLVASEFEDVKFSMIDIESFSLDAVKGKDVAILCDGDLSPGIFRKLAGAFGELTVIIVSEDVDVESKYGKKGIFSVLKKPLDVNNVSDILKRALSGNSGYISIEDVMKLDLRIAEILEADLHPNADKLLVLKIKVADDVRTIVAGIRKSYSPEDLIGKKIVIVYNLKPVKLRGVESNGMLLAASDADTVTLIVPDNGEIPSGAKVK